MTHQTILLSSLALSALLVVACGDDETTSTTSATTNPTTSSSGSGASGGGGSAAGGMGGSSGAAMGRVRVAHLSPDAPAVDFCVDPGSGFIGPVLNGAGDADGLAYGEVTGYVDLPAATYAVRLVAPGATNCDTPLGPADTSGITLPDAVDATIAATGMLTPAGNDQAFMLNVYVDDNAAPAGSMAKLRFIHASPDTPGVDVGTGSEAGSDFAVIWDNVSYPEVGQVNGGDYLETPALSGVTISAQANDSMTDALVIPGVNLPAGAIATAFAIGNLDATPQPLKVLLCVDTDIPTCSIVP